MIKTYLTYFSYDNSEYSVWGISTNREESIESFKKIHVPSLIEGRQPDISQLYLIEVDLDSSVYLLFEKNYPEDDISISDMLEYIENKYEDYNVIFSCDGTINFDLVEYYFRMNTDPEDDVEFDDWEWTLKLDELETTDPDSYKNLVDDFVKHYFE